MRNLFDEAHCVSSYDAIMQAYGVNGPVDVDRIVKRAQMQMAARHAERTL